MKTRLFLVLCLMMFLQTSFSADALLVSHAVDSSTVEQADHVSNHSASTEEVHAEAESHGANLAPLLFIIMALFVGTATRFLLRKSPLPYTISLLVIGLLLGILTRSGFFDNLHIKAFADSIEWAGSIDPHLILYLFLPTLIFEAAFALHVHTFKKLLGNAVILAIPGLAVAIVITAAIAIAIANSGLGLGAWTWPVALLFGTIVSATDPVAVVAILKDVGASKKLGTLTESESMLNDGTAIVIFMVLIAIVSGEASDGNAALNFLRVVFGGILVGVGVGWLILGWVKRVFNDALIEITVVIGAAYLAFFIAENVLHFSGVIAVVTFGLAMAGPGRTRISPEVSHFLHEFWELAAFIANTLIFIIVGVVISQKVSVGGADLVILLIIYAGIHVARLCAIYLFYPLMKRIGYGLDFKDSVVLWWGGLRGAVGLALALIVAMEEKIPFEIRSQVLTLTAGLVVLTSLINATTIKFLIGALGLSKVGDTKLGLLRQSIQQMRQGGEKEIEKLKDNRYMSGANWEVVKGYLSDAKVVVEDAKAFSLEEAVWETRKRLLQKEKESYWRQFSMGLLTPNAVQILSDQIENLMDYGGKESLAKRSDIEQLWKTPKVYVVMQSLPILGKFWERIFFERLTTSYDCARAFVTAQEENLKSLSSLIISFSQNSDTVGKEVDILSGIEDEINENRISGLTFVRILKENNPEVCRAIETQLASRSLLNQQQDMVERLKKQGRLEPSEVEKIEAEIQQRMKKLLDSSPKIDFKQELAELLANTPGFNTISSHVNHLLVKEFKEKVFSPGKVLLKEGTAPDGFYFVVNGSARVEQKGRLIRLVESGETLGVFELISQQTNRVTVTAESPVTTVKLSAKVFWAIKNKIADFESVVWFAASAEVARVLLASVEPYSGWSTKKIRTFINKGSVHRISPGEKDRLACTACILIKGIAIVDEFDQEFQSPAVLPSGDVRGKSETIVFAIP